MTALESLTLDEVEAYIAGLSEAQRAQLAAGTKRKLVEAWLPQPGPQSEAFYCEADELLYGGAAGGGKSDLIAGLAVTAHRRSLVFRAQATDLRSLWDRLVEITEGRRRSKNDVQRSMTLVDGRVIEGGHLDTPGSERAWMGRPHDLIAFDEAAQLSEFRVNFVLQWLRSTEKGQRKRAVFATNPPIPEFDDAGQMIDTGLGDWLVRWFAPWIDDLFPDPAEPGEIRWCFMRADGNRLVTVWVAGPGCYDPQTGEPRPDATAEDIDKGRVAVARSRTFIRSLLSDNAFLKGTGYAERLSGTPEPLKSMLLNGDFTVRGEDHPQQIIPTQWVLEAQERWKQRDEAEVLKLRQLVLYGDIAQGGVDHTVLASLCETDYYDELLTKPGRDTPNGASVAALLMRERLDLSLVALDATGGWAGGAATALEERYGIEVELHAVSKTDGSYAPDMPYRYGNLRAKMWWEFRLALDPKSEFRICLPPGTRLLSQLTTPHWLVKGKILYVEGKDDIRKRLAGASTDEADAVLGAWQYREQAIRRRADPQADFIDRINGRDPQRQTEEYDPRADW